MRYTRTQEWVELEDSDIVIVGVSNRVQRSLGEILFVELPAEGEEFEQEDTLGSIESIDGVIFNIHSPVTGEVIEVNTHLENSPDLINRSPEGDGWLIKMRMEIPKEFNTLMTADEFEEYEADILEGEDEDFDEEDEDYY